MAAVPIKGLIFEIQLLWIKNAMTDYTFIWLLAFLEKKKLKRKRNDQIA